MTVGETLSRARRKRKLSVADVAADTRIRASLIDAIERDQFAACGGAVYARGHIRSIARVVGLDPVPLIEEFDTIHHVERPVPVAATTADHVTDLAVVARAEHHKPNWTLAAAAALVIICALAVTGLLHGRGAPSHHNSANPPTANGPTVQQTAPTTTQGTPPPTTTTTTVSTTRATMLIRARNGRTWLQVKNKAGQQLFAGFLEVGQHRSFSARGGLAYVIGNAPAVDVVVNGNDVGAPRSPTVVAQGNVTPGNATLHQT